LKKKIILLIFQIVSWLGYANSSVNPVIYGIFNRDFRRAFTRIMNKIIYCNDEERRLNKTTGTIRTRTESESFRLNNKSRESNNLIEQQQKLIKKQNTKTTTNNNNLFVRLRDCF
jgi:hypothetical protein